MVKIRQNLGYVKNGLRLSSRGAIIMSHEQMSCIRASWVKRTERTLSKNITGDF